MDMIVKNKILALLEESGSAIENCDDIDLREYVSDSLGFINLIICIEEEFCIELPDEALQYNKLSSINGFSNYLETIINDPAYSCTEHEDCDDYI